MVTLRARVGAGAIAALLAFGMGACSVSNSSTNGSSAPTTNPTGAGARPSVDPTALPSDWPAEATTPEGMTIVDVKVNDSGTTVLGNAKGDDAIKAGEALKAAWEKNGALITSSDDANKTFYMSALSKDGKTQLTATISTSGGGPLQIILTRAPANQ